MKKSNIISSIRKTNNYNLFSLMETGNRVIDKNHVKRIQSKIETYDLTPFQPILVYKRKDKLVIVDGQHRYIACKNLNIPVYHIIVPKSKGLEILIFQLNSGNKRHTLDDKLKIQRDFGNRTIQKVFNIHKCQAPKMSLSTVTQLLFSCGTGGQVSRALDRKTYKINYRKEFDMIVNFIEKLNLPDWKWNGAFVYAVSQGVFKFGTRSTLKKMAHHRWKKEASPKAYREQFYDCTNVKIA